MKKIYTKPEILFDSFEISQNIAAGCELISNQAYGSCALIDEEINVTVFGGTISGCFFTTDDEKYQSLCYHAPSDTLNGFSS